METQPLGNAFYIQLDGVIEAYHNRAFARKQIRSAQNETASAAKMVSQFGMYEDCGDSYESEYDAAKAVEAYTVRMKVSAEKHFKARKMAFFETYGSRAKAALREHITTE